MTAPVRVVVVDDHPMWRAGVRADLEQDGFLVVADAGTVAAAVAAAALHRPDLVLLDLHLPDGAGAAAIGPMLQRVPDCRVLVLSASGEEADVLAAIKAGATGYLLKSATGAELLAAARQVIAGEPVFSPAVAALVLGEFRRLAGGGSPPGPQAALTPRETEILRMVARGYAYRDIAERLVLSVRTVQNHVQSILRKLHFTSRHELMRFAMERGLDGGE